MGKNGEECFPTLFVAQIPFSLLACSLIGNLNLDLWHANENVQTNGDIIHIGDRLGDIEF